MKERATNTKWATTPRRLLARWIVGLCLISLLISGCGGQTVNQPAAPTSTPVPTAPAVARPTYTVQRGDVQQLLTFSGRWQPRDQIQLAFEIGGTMRRVNVRRSDTVHQGDLLADYDIADLENQLATAKVNLEVAQAAEQRTTSGSVQSVEDAEIALANARLNLDNAQKASPWIESVAAQEQLKTAQRQLENAQRAYDEAISRPDASAASVDSAYEALMSAQSGVNAAQRSIASAGAQFVSYEHNVKTAENAVLQAELALERARNGAPNSSRDVLTAQMTIDQLNAKIAQSSLVAPIDGVVLEVAIKPGDQVQAYKAVITLAIPEPKEVIATLAITDAQRLSPGMIGTCQVMNRPETAVQCAVRQIPLSNRDADQSTRIGAALNLVTAMTDNQLVEVKMPLQTRANVLWLPPVAIRTFQNRTFVVLDTPDGPRSVDVQIGLRTDDRVEIISGVSEGDVVVGP
jgi:multidrug efflux pump subunit AcrA (membrane-fusion protein)